MTQWWKKRLPTNAIKTVAIYSLHLSAYSPFLPFLLSVMRNTLPASNPILPRGFRWVHGSWDHSYQPPLQQDVPMWLSFNHECAMCGSHFLKEAVLPFSLSPPPHWLKRWQSKCLRSRNGSHTLRMAKPPCRLCSVLYGLERYAEAGQHNQINIWEEKE